MKKWIAILTTVACAFSSVRAEAPSTPNPEGMIVAVEADDQNTDTTPDEQARTPVGKAASDGSSTGSGAGKYVLAAGAIAVAIAALILVSRHSGHHHHHHHHSH
jgi:hypothetical protein